MVVIDTIQMILIRQKKIMQSIRLLLTAHQAAERKVGFTVIIILQLTDGLLWLYTGHLISTLLPGKEICLSYSFGTASLEHEFVNFL